MYSDLMVRDGARIWIDDVDENTEGIRVQNSSTAEDARAILAKGMTEIEGNFTDNPASIALLVANPSTHDDARALKVEDKAEFDGKVQFDGETEFNDKVTVGPSDAAGEIDSGGIPATPRNLKIGTRNVTSEVEIGRSGKDTVINGELTVTEKSNFGDPNTDGMIDARGNLRDLKIGTDQTKDVILSRVGQTIDMFGQARMNSNAVVMNDADAITDADGCGMLFNPNGHPGPNMPCIDFYILGAVVGYVDENGWNNA